MAQLYPTCRAPVVVAIAHQQVKSPPKAVGGQVRDVAARSSSGDANEGQLAGTFSLDLSTSLAKHVGDGDRWPAGRRPE
ncbi:MAG TPA: hypothetical protein VK629_04625 [Steroidobacteraceae bacterium]|nr:hypothetical protein [Steroidobacteraceae bacterium]